jgi:hypothetical protein
MIAETTRNRNNRPYSALDLAGDLAGVPKPVLRTVFGEHLGRRIWEFTRGPRKGRAHAGSSRPAEPLRPEPGAADEPAETDVSRKRMATQLVNAEILRGMIEYLSRRAGETLDQNRRLVRSATLTLCFDDGKREIGNTRLTRPTKDPAEICEAVSELFRGFRAGDAALESINLTTSSIQVESIVEATSDLSCALAGAHS